MLFVEGVAFGLDCRVDGGLVDCARFLVFLEVSDGLVLGLEPGLELLEDDALGLGKPFGNICLLFAKVQLAVELLNLFGVEHLYHTRQYTKQISLLLLFLAPSFPTAHLLVPSFNKMRHLVRIIRRTIP